ncbi:uncharacterized protein CLUP02_00084 [Colletotrichum lupini]|uniref:Uncharacterized protein n=1 Tax=Colletotrichum lupini TaxID=145971 RepID=A0A9Q8SA09_9PEZI|nr:uncharacterized protein CLUP02_00084 [Colletotrichum lupini]UQC73440.1 hypothetical protein CLUP02_00084 [Colletotrichum lupini]
MLVLITCICSITAAFRAHHQQRLVTHGWANPYARRRIHQKPTYQDKCQTTFDHSCYSDKHVIANPMVQAFKSCLLKILYPTCSAHQRDGSTRRITPRPTRAVKTMKWRLESYISLSGLLSEYIPGFSGFRHYGLAQPSRSRHAGKTMDSHERLSQLMRLARQLPETCNGVDTFDGGFCLLRPFLQLVNIPHRSSRGIDEIFKSAQMIVFRYSEKGSRGGDNKPIGSLLVIVLPPSRFLSSPVWCNYIMGRPTCVRDGRTRTLFRWRVCPVFKLLVARVSHSHAPKAAANRLGVLSNLELNTPPPGY